MIISYNTENKKVRPKTQTRSFIKSIDQGSSGEIESDKNITPQAPKEVGEVTKKVKRISYEKISQDLKDVSKKIKKEIKEEIQPEFNGLKTNIETIEKRTEQNKLRLIETLALFVALFTFVSVNIQIFRSPLSLLSAAGFVLIMLGSLSLFLLIMHFILLNLNFKKTITLRGSMSRFVRSIMSSDWKEEVEFKFWHGSTWGDGFKVFFLLFIFSTVLIGLGVYLVSRDTTVIETNGTEEKLDRAINVEFKNNQIKIPDNINIINKEESNNK